jgi:hypothetical protein
VHRTALDRYCTRVLDECTATIRAADISPHDRYLRLFRLLKECDQSIATAFDDLRRSTAVQRLAAMIALGVVSDEELDRFSAATRASATALADLSRPSEKRRKAR